MKVSQILKQKGLESYSVKADQLLTHAVELMTDNKVGSVIVTSEDGGLASIVTERDVMYAARKYNADLSQVKVSDVMAPELVTCTGEETLEQAMDIMMNNSTGHRIRHIPMVNDGKLVGVISIGDIVESLLNKAKFENKLLKSYIKNWPETEEG